MTMSRPAAVSVARRLRRFGADRRGTVSFEAVIILPVLMFGLGMTVLLSDMFKSQTTSLKAAYTIADTLSRLTEPVEAEYIDGLNKLYGYLARSRHNTWLRVSSVAYDVAEEEYILIWSHAAGTPTTLTTETLNDGLADRLPSMPTGETVIIVEAATRWSSFIPGWFRDRNFAQVVVTRPRFTPQLRYDTGDMIVFLPFGSGTCDDGGALCTPEDEGT
jgi:hypothetical protein